MAQVLFEGARWFVPSATLTVMVALPGATPVTTTLFPDTCTVAIPVLLDVALIAPSPALVTAITWTPPAPPRVALVGLRLRLPADLTMLQGTDLAEEDPSGHWKFGFGVTVAA